MATHSSMLAWRIPETEEPDRLQSTRLQESYTTKPPPRTGKQIVVPPGKLCLVKRTALQLLTWKGLPPRSTVNLSKRVADSLLDNQRFQPGYILEALGGPKILEPKQTYSIRLRRQALANLFKAAKRL